MQSAAVSEGEQKPQSIRRATAAGDGAGGVEGLEREGGRESGSDNETKRGRDGCDSTRGKGEERSGTGESQTGEPPVTPPPSFSCQGGRRGEREAESLGTFGEGGCWWWWEGWE